MVNAKATSINAGNQIKDELNLRVTNVLGIYDLVVELSDNNIRDLNKYIEAMKTLPAIASTTTYLVIDDGVKARALERPYAYVLVKTTPLEVYTIRSKFFEIEEVQKADVVWGPYDIIVEVCVDSLHNLIKLLKKVLGSPGLVKTTTLVAFPPTQ